MGCVMRKTFFYNGSNADKIQNYEKNIPRTYSLGITVMQKRR